MDELLAELRALRAEVAELRAELRSRPDPGSARLSVEQTAERLGCSRSRVFELLAAGRLSRARKAGRATMVSLASVEAFDAAGGAAAPVRPERALSPSRPFNAEEELAALREGLRKAGLKKR